MLRLAPYDGYFYGSYGLQNFKLSGAQLPHVLVPQNNFKDVFNNTCDIYRRLQSAHFLSSDD